MNFFYTIFLIVFGFIFINFFKKQLPIREIAIIRKLWIFNLVITIVHYIYTNNESSDAWVYWSFPKYMDASAFWSYLFYNGTYFIYALNYIPVKILGMGFFVNTLLFSLFGFIGLILIYIVAFKIIPYNSRFGKFLLFPTLFFLPNLHFWSSGLGKDSLVFFALGLLFYSLLNFKKHIPFFLIALILIYQIRPHIALFLVFSFGLALLVDAQIKFFKRLLLSALLISISIFIFPNVMEFASIEEASLESFEEFSSKKSELLSRAHTVTRLDSNTSYPIKLFAFLFRPFFFDINGIPALIASIENLFLLLLSIKLLLLKPFAAFKNAPFIVKGLFFYILIGTLVFSATLGNIGIMIRMRNMFLPGLIIFILWVFSYQYQRKIEKQKRSKLLK